ncbi:MAG: HNH endonuclease [Xenococcaceae cyanobacterium]
MECKLCQREMDSLTIHHLIPRQYLKRKKIADSPTVSICTACHKQIHALFDNKKLARELNSLDKLKQEPKMEKFLSWVKKQKPQKRVTVRRQR